VKRHRSAVTGRFVSARYAAANPTTTIAEDAGIVAALRAKLAAALGRNREPQ
jgi:hypothetical protein